MGDPVELRESAPSAPVALPQARAMAGEAHIARLLRTGAVLAGLCFFISLVLGALPQSPATAYAIDALRKGGVVLLVVTPILRLLAAGVLLGLRGEWKYTIYAACILLLLCFAVAAGLAA